jgi:hypothetical protein
VADHRAHDADQRGLVLAEGRELPAPRGREITGWSAKSRANMISTLASLDYTGWQAAGLIPAMVTLTLPGDWLVIAPTGQAFKALVFAFRRRFARAWGYPLDGLWKLEFQRRGAPHFHLWTCPPRGLAGELRQLGRRRRPAVGDGLAWREWARAVWADICDHPDPEHRARHERAGVSTDYAEGMRAIDPRRLAVYFAKHGSYRAKDYQNCEPPEWQAPGDGPGRFWGYWGLERAEVAIELDPAHWAPLARTVRRWAAAQGVTRQVAAPRYRGGRPRPAGDHVHGLAGAQLVREHKRRRRKVRRPVSRLRRGTGFVVVNDAPGLAAELARVQRMLT